MCSGAAGLKGAGDSLFVTTWRRHIHGRFEESRVDDPQRLLRATTLWADFKTRGADISGQRSTAGFLYPTTEKENSRIWGGGGWTGIRQRRSAKTHDNLGMVVATAIICTRPPALGVTNFALLYSVSDRIREWDLHDVCTRLGSGLSVWCRFVKWGVAFVYLDNDGCWIFSRRNVLYIRMWIRFRPARRTVAETGCKQPGDGTFCDASDSPARRLPSLESAWVGVGYLF